MKIVVTGAAGHLGSHLIPLLVENGNEVVGLDMVEPGFKTDYDFRHMSLMERDRLSSVLEDVGLVVHAASIHPWKEYRDEEYLDANIKGTWQLYSAIKEAGIRDVVLTSSIAAAGYHGIPVAGWPVTEEAQFPIGDLYSLTKYTQEQIARHCAFASGIRTIALRPPAFMPMPQLNTGMQLTGNFCVVDDIASAHLAAVSCMLENGIPNGEGSFEAYFTVNELPYTAADGALLTSTRDISPLATKYWPEEFKWLTEKGCGATGIAALYDISKAERELGWKPKYNFDQWAAEHIG